MQAEEEGVRATPSKRRAVLIPVVTAVAIVVCLSLAMIWEDERYVPALGMHRVFSQSRRRPAADASREMLVLGQQRSTRPKEPQPREGVAVCMVGQLRALQSSAQSIRRHVIDVLHADTFISTSRDADFNKLHLFNLTNSDSSRTDQLSAHRRTVVERPFGVRLFNYDTAFGGRVFRVHSNPPNFNFTAWYERLSGPHVRDFRELLAKADDTGNFRNDWLMPLAGWGHVRGCRKKQKSCGSGAIQSHHLHNCKSMIRAQEAHRGMRYKFVRILRSDSLWRADHVPPSLLDESASRCYLPHCAGYSFGLPHGYCDFGAICSRDGADVYLDAANIIAREPDQVPGESTIANSEAYLQWRLDRRNVTVQRLPEVSYITCECKVVEGQKRDCSITPTGNSKCVWDDEEKVPFKHRLGKQLVASRVFARYINKCGWSRQLLSATQHWSQELLSRVAKATCDQYDWSR